MSELSDRELCLTENWRLVTYQGVAVEVSDRGNVRRPGSGRNLKTTLRSGYPKLCLSAGSKKVNVHVHALVALAFVGPRPERYEVNHIDGVRHNNTASNLEYVTRSGNAKHAVRLGLIVVPENRPFGSGHGRAKLSEQIVPEIRASFSAGVSQRRLATRYGVDRRTIQRVLYGENWRHVPIAEAALAALEK